MYYLVKVPSQSIQTSQYWLVVEHLPHPSLLSIIFTHVVFTCFSSSSSHANTIICLTHWNISWIFFMIWFDIDFESQTLDYTHGRRKVHKRMLVVWAAQRGLNDQRSCLHSFKIFCPLKPSYISNKMTEFVAHFDAHINKYMKILKMYCTVNQIDDLQSSNKK